MSELDRLRRRARDPWEFVVRRIPAIGPSTAAPACALWRASAAQGRPGQLIVTRVTDSAHLATVVLSGRP